MAESDFYMCEHTMLSYTFPSATVSERAHIYTQSMGENNLSNLTLCLFKDFEWHG